jgi:hypothetical protein
MLKKKSRSAGLLVVSRKVGNRNGSRNGKVNAMNLEFLSEQFRLHKLYSVVCEEYSVILSLFIPEDLLLTMKLADINPSNATLYQKLDGIQLGGRCEALLNRQPLGEKEVRFR